jgi:hypothetical protein
MQDGSEGRKEKALEIELNEGAILLRWANSLRASR